MIRKTVGLFAGVVLAMVALAIPASASATTTVLDNGAVYNGEIAFGPGTWKFELLGTGMECTEVTMKIKQNGNDEQDVTAFNILNPTTKCNFFGAVYGGCEFETGGHPLATSLPWKAEILDLTDNVTIKNSTVTSAPGIIDAETKNQTGKTCNITTNDLTLVHEPNTSLTLELETDANKFITGLVLKGKVKFDSAGSAAGTTTTGHSTSIVTIGGTLPIEIPNTFKLN